MRQDDPQQPTRSRSTAETPSSNTSCDRLTFHVKHRDGSGTFAVQRAGGRRIRYATKTRHHTPPDRHTTTNNGIIGRPSRGALNHSGGSTCSRVHPGVSSMITDNIHAGPGQSSDHHHNRAQESPIPTECRFRADHSQRKGVPTPTDARACPTTTHWHLDPSSLHTTAALRRSPLRPSPAPVSRETPAAHSLDAPPSHHC